jgi:HAMP domain-containing protein
MGLRMKILCGFSILTIMLFVAGIWSIYELTGVGTSVQRLLDENYKSINAAKVMVEALERQDSGILILLLGDWEEGRSILESGDSLFQKGFDTAKANVTIPGESAYVEAIESTYKIFKDLWVKPVVGTKHEGDLNWYLKEVHKAFMDAKAAVTRLMELNDETMYQTASELKARTHRAVMPGVVAILSALVFTLLFNYFTNYYVISPIIRLTAAVRRFLQTREPVDVKIETRDEIFDLAISIKDLLRQASASSPK